MTEVNTANPPRVFDSERQQVGESYARALIGLGKARESSGSVSPARLVEELAGFVTAVRQNPRLMAALDSPRVSESEKLRVVDAVLAGRTSQDFVNFIRILVQRSRFDCLEAILASATRQLDETSGRVRGVVTSAAPIDPAALEQLSRNLSRRLGREVVLQTEVDPAILGGVVVRVGDTVYDASVRNRLGQLKVRAARNASAAIRSQLDRFVSGL